MTSFEFRYLNFSGFFGSGVPTGIFKAMDDSGDGLLSEEEMSEWLLDESHLIFGTVFFWRWEATPEFNY